MKVIALACAGLVGWAVGTMFAQELPPELAEPAAKYKAAVESLEKQRLENVALAVKPYVGLLDGIETAATAKGDVDLVAAVTKEREAAESGTLNPELPAALPKAKLQGARKALLMKLETIGKDFAQRRKQTDGDYLRSLATLQTKAPPGSELAKQLAAEKSALLNRSGTASGSDPQTSKLPRAKNAVVNGDFEKVVDGKPEAWKMPECEFVTVERENKNTFLRFNCPVRADGKAGYYSVRQEIDLPKGAKIVAVSAKLKTKNDTGNIFPRAQVGFLNQEDKFFGCAAAWGNGKKGPWQKIHADMDIPKTAIKAFVEVINDQCPGQIDFDDIEVTFK